MTRRPIEYFESISRARKMALLIAIEAVILTAFVALISDPVALGLALVGWVLTRHAFWIVALAIVVGYVDAVVVVELFRMAIPAWESWSDRKHFRLVAILWAVLFALLTLSAFIVRHRMHVPGV